jgi:PAS domain S-box-containing protein
VGLTAAADSIFARGIFLLPMVAIAAMSGAWGLGPGLLTLALTSLLALGPGIHAAGDGVLFALFIVAGLIAVVMGEGLRRGWRRAADREAAVQNSEMFYRSLFENATDVTSLLAPDGRNCFLSPAAQRILGYTPDERLGRNALDLVHPDDMDAVLQALHEVMVGTRANRPIEYRFLTKSGAWRWLESTARNQLEDPAVRAIVVNSRDVTDRRLAEERIRFQAHLLDAVGQAVLATDRSGRVRYMNVAAETLTGWESGAALGQPIESVLPVLGGTATDTAAGPVEFTLRRRDGVEVPVLATGTVLNGVGGTYDGVVTVLVDITERQRTEVRLRENEEKLQQSRKLEAIGQLAGGVAHDFNNLLTGIRGFAQFAYEALPVESPVRSDLEEIQRSADRAASLTSQLLAFGRRQVLRSRVLDLNTCVTETTRLLQRLIGEDIRIVTRLATGLGSVKADPGQIEQVLVNLTLNARDAMPTGGELVVRTMNTELSEEDARRNPFDVRPGPYVMLSVTDSGHGMDPVTLEHVFEPFFTTKPPGAGNGLGMSTVYGIIKQSEGYIWVDSAPGQGATARVYLPRIDEVRSPSPGQKARETAARGTETVLLVEDDDIVRALTRRVLDRNGYQVLEARNGVEALEIAEPSEQLIDLVISDIVMPELGGRQLVERLRKIRPEVPVLLISGYTDDAIVRHGIMESGEPFLPKPFTNEALTRKVRAVLDA